MEDANSLKKETLNFLKLLIFIVTLLLFLTLASWLIFVENFNRGYVNLSLSIIIIHVVLSIAVYFKPKPLFCLFFYSVISFFGIFSVSFVSGYRALLMNYTPLWLFFYALLYLVLGLSLFRYFSNVYQSTLEDNIASGKIDIENAEYSLVIPYAPYKSKNKVMLKVDKFFRKSWVYFLPIVIVFGGHLFKGINDENVKIGYMSLALSIGCLVFICDRLVNLIWLINWQRKNKKSMKIMYLD